MMEFIHINSETNGYIKAVEHDLQIGVITYYWEDEHTIVVDHTEVNPQFEGRGIGAALVQEILHYADSQHLKIIPLCPFVKVVLERTGYFKKN